MLDRQVVPAAIARLGAEEGLSSSQGSLLAVQHPLRRRVLRHPLQDPGCFPWPSPQPEGLGSLLVRLSAGLRDDACSGFAAAADRPVARPLPGALPGTLASPRTRLPLAGCPELVARVAAIDHPLSGFVDVRPPGCWTHQADVKWRAVSGPAARERGGVRRGAEGPTFLQKGRMPHLLEQSSPSLRAGDEAGGCQGPHECQSKPDRSGHWRPCDGFRDSLLGNNS